MTSIVVVAKVVVVVSIVIVIGYFSKVVLVWFLTLQFGSCVRAAECRWWKLFLWQLVMLVEGFFMYVG